MIAGYINGLGRVYIMEHGDQTMERAGRTTHSAYKVWDPGKGEIDGDLLITHQRSSFIALRLTHPVHHQPRPDQRGTGQDL